MIIKKLIGIIFFVIFSLKLDEFIKILFGDYFVKLIFRKGLLLEIFENLLFVRKKYGSGDCIIVYYFLYLRSNGDVVDLFVCFLF